MRSTLNCNFVESTVDSCIYNYALLLWNNIGVNMSHILHKKFI